jgi:hypothetical protein
MMNVSNVSNVSIETNAEFLGTRCPLCWDKMTTHSNYRPVCSDVHDNIVCQSCYDETKVSAETFDDGALYTVWVDGAIITGFKGYHRDASDLANWWLGKGYTDVTLMLENADEVYGI